MKKLLLPWLVELDANQICRISRVAVLFKFHLLTMTILSEAIIEAEVFMSSFSSDPLAG